MNTKMVYQFRMGSILHPLCLSTLFAYLDAKGSKQLNQFNQFILTSRIPSIQKTVKINPRNHSKAQISCHTVVTMGRTTVSLKGTVKVYIMKYIQYV